MSTGVILSLKSRYGGFKSHPTSLIKFNAPPGHWEPFGGGGLEGMFLCQPPTPWPPPPVSCLVTFWALPCTRRFCFSLCPCANPNVRQSFPLLDPGPVPQPHEAPPCSRTLPVVSKSLAARHSKQLPVTEGQAVFLAPASGLPPAPPPPSHPGLPFLLSDKIQEVQLNLNFTWTTNDL